MEEKAMTKDELLSLVRTAAVEAVGPAVAKALEPVTQAQTSYFDALAAREKRAAEDKMEPGIKFARQVRILALGKGDPERGLWTAKKAWGIHADGDPVIGDLEKALTAGNAGQAGNLILPEYSRELIPLLRNAQAFSRIPAVRYLPMPAGSLSMRKQTAAGTAYYVGESSNVTPSQQTIGTLTLSAKKCVGLTPVSNDLLRQGGADVDRIVRDDLVQVVALKRDLAFFAGDGTGSSPRGVLNLVDSSHSFAEGGTALSNIQSDYTKLIRLVQVANIDANGSNSAFVMSAQVKWGIQKVATTTGDMIFRAEVEQGRLFGFPIVISEQVGTTRVFFINGPSSLVGETLNFQVDASDGAAYYDGSAVVSGFSRDETPIRVIDEHDFLLRHDKGASVLTSVTLS